MKILYIIVIMIVVLSIDAQNLCVDFSTYLGGNQFDEIKSICIDSKKDCYIIGNTYSNNLPITAGLINDTASGDYDVFIAKFDSCGGLVWCTYFGGTGFESAEKMCFTTDSNIVFSGYTSSVDLPTTTSAFQSTNLGGYDAYLVKITPSGQLIWCTYFGKNGGDMSYDLTVDINNNIIIGGTSTSTNLYTTPSSFQPNHKGNMDAFIAKFNSNGALKWCTYYGGNGSEDIHAITSDSNGNIIGVGESFSTNLDVSSGAFQAFKNGASDVYIIKLDSIGNRVFSTYFGGDSSDDAWGVVCDANLNIYIAGQSKSSDFFTTPSCYQANNTGYFDCFISKWNSNGSLITSTLFGGAGNDGTNRLKLLDQTTLVLLSKTESTSLPIYSTSLQDSVSGGFDIYLSVFDTNSLHPQWATYYGGSTDDTGNDLVVLNANNLFFTGSSNSINYPTSTSAYQPNLYFSNDGIITRLQLPNSINTNITTTEQKQIHKIYPNPFSDFIKTTKSNPVRITIRDVLGNTICETENESYINTSNLLPGLYIISVNNQSQLMIKE